MQTSTFKSGSTAPSTKSVNPTETYAVTLPSTGYVRVHTVSAVCGIAVSTVWAWVAQGRFPRPVKLSKRATRWLVADVRAWLADPTGWQANNRTEKSNSAVKEGA